MKIFNLMANIRKAVVVTTLGLFLCGQVRAMELVTPERADNTLVYVKTFEGDVAPIARWKIDKMKTLSVLFESQNGQNSENNPIDILEEVTLQELKLLSDALDRVNQSEEASREWFFSLVRKGCDLRIVEKENGFGIDCPVSLGSALYKLRWAAEMLEATELDSLCLRYFNDIAEKRLRLAPYFIDPVVSDILSHGKDRIMRQGIRTLHTDASKVVFYAACSADGKKLLSVGAAGPNNIALWDIEDGRCIKKVTAHKESAKVSGALSPDGSMFATCGESRERNLILWDAKTGQEINRVFPVDKVPKSVAFSPDGTKMVVGYHAFKNNVVIWDPFTGKILQVLNDSIGEAPVSSVAFSPDGMKVAVGYLNFGKNIIVFDLSDKNNIKKEVFIGHPRNVLSVAFSHNGDLLISGADGETENLRIWDVRTKNMVADLKGHGPVFSAQFSPDDRKIVAGGYSGSIGSNLILWSYDASQSVMESQSYIIRSDLRNIYSVGFTPDGNSIFACGDGSDVTLYSLFTQKDRNALGTIFDLNLVQAVLVYKLYNMVVLDQQSLRLTGVEQKVFDSLPESLRKLLLKLFQKQDSDEAKKYRRASDWNTREEDDYDR